MKPSRYEYDNKSMRYRKARFNFLGLISNLLRVILVSLSLFVVLYFVLAAFISTDTEKRLAREIRAYEKAYPSISPRSKLLEKSIAALEVKDNEIYRNVFHNEAPSVDPIGSLDMFFGADTVPDTKIVTYTTAKADRLIKQSARVSAAFEEIYRNLAARGKDLPPMLLPVDEISYPQIGASTGPRLNPIIKAEVRHNGLDFIVPRGSTVRATADGVVGQVVRSSKGDGNTVLLMHSGGYETRYCHLEEIKVRQGETIRKGRKIGTSGMSGSAFAPHLHYEVLLNGIPMDPINYIFASVGPREYSNMLYMATYTKQSMD